MKQIFIFLMICAGLLLAEISHAGESADAIDKAVLDFLGCDRIKTILDSEKAESYRIDWRGISDKNAMTLEGYPVMERGKDLDIRYIRLIKKMICLSGSYEFQWAKRTRVRPSYMLRFIQGKESVCIAIDFDSSQWAFHYNGDVAEEDINSKTAKPVLSDMIRSLFED